MGCTQSKVQNQECVWRCRQRKRFVKGALSSRNALAAAYAGYFGSLRNCSSAFRDFADAEFGSQHLSSSPPGAASSSSSPVPVKIIRSFKALEATPSAPVTVVLSPPHTNQREYLEYLYNDAPPPGLYSNVPVPSSSPPAPYHPEPIYQEDVYSPPTTPLNGGWDIFDLFRPPPAQMHYQELRRSKNEYRKQVFDYDDMPALEEDDSFPQVKVRQKKTEDYSDLEKEEMEVPDMATSSKVSSLQSEENIEPTVKVAQYEKELPEVLKEIDENFLKASAAAKEVCRLLEVNKIHHHSNFSDSKGFSDQSSRFLSSVSRGYWSPKTPLSWTSASEDSTTEETSSAGGSHVVTLDRLYAWEKKLYEQMKETEVLKVEFEKQCKRFRNLDAKGEGYEKIDKTRAVIKSLESEMMVAVEAIEKTSLAIRRMTEEELYPQLMDLLEGLAHMWKEVSECHQRQKFAVLSIRVPNISMEETSKSQRQATLQLQAALDVWQLTSSSISRTQIQYLENLLGWLNSIFKYERDPKYKGSALSSMSPRIYQLCKQWKEALDKLDEKPALDALKSFTSHLQDMIEKQNEEASIQKNIRFLSKELKRKITALNNAQNKYGELAVVQEDDSAGGKVIMNSPVSEKKAAVHALKQSLEREQEKFTRVMQATRYQTFHTLKDGLPELFSAVSDFASSCSQTYQEIRSQARNGKLTE
ncbi:hypothetical protein O6H91_05G129500 [Diphasiastrum complanatum]|uniref:Uncharacterized protein n=2 Tax=Diphasiastrum complanatum TaxID=34168 RepID=A0ACC2DTQ5_DIPCM|nr:hypothetical protein O6H91_Y232200 [Diphasiastrum complanatum]KAJ7294792.1 hypothetical protein O6H91_Y232200 [Diphasiastrum complanatum]KAJ7557510.1 hypothetical protein O6H91_05G129500 [Diphasiastrum complanatum]KAJ7557511.1 hypothetical protein O6H91_05G129500 [Diphasiastrum complanatum]